MRNTIAFNPVDVPGGMAGDGGTGRIVDPTTGAGLFNPNLDPAVVGIDPLTGLDAPSGTDVSFGAAIRRQMQTNVINGDFAVPPPLGVSTAIVSDPADAGYNPLPGWYVTSGSDGLVSTTVETAAGAASGQVLRIVAATGHTTVSYAECYQYIPVPRSQGQQYRALLSAYVTVTGSLLPFALAYQYFTADLTAIGSLAYTVLNSSAAEFKLDAGLVPATATYLRVTVSPGRNAAAATADIYEVRCAFLPAEATVGLGTLSVATGGISNTQAVVKSITIPANTLTVGSTYRFMAYAMASGDGVAGRVLTLRIRIGTTTLTGNIASSVAPTINTGASSDGFHIGGLFTVRSVGATGTCIGGLHVVGKGTQPFASNAAASDTNSTVVVDTTVENQLELTAVTAAAGASINVHLATIECIMAS